MTRSIFCLAALLLIASACGLKGVPVPVNRRVAASQLRLTAIKHGGNLTLTFQIPSGAANRIDELLLLKFVAGQRFAQVVSKRRPSAGQRVSIWRLTAGKKLRYAVALKLVGQRQGLVGPAIDLTRLSSPSAPVGFDVRCADLVARLRWRDPPRPCITQIQRRSQTGRWTTVLNRIAAAKPFLDANLLGERRYDYRARTICRRGLATAIGPWSKAHAISTIDRSAPYRPLNLRLATVTNGVRLNWDDVKDSNLAGYNVYMRRLTQRRWIKLNTKLMKHATYYAKVRDLVKSVVFAVTAVDASPQHNESKRSQSQILRSRGDVPAPEIESLKKEL